MRDRLPRDSSSEDEVVQGGGGSEGSWDAHRSRRGHHQPLPAGSVGSAGSSPYMGRRTKFVGRTERFHQRRLSRDYRDEMEEDDVWKMRQNGLPPQCVPWRVSQSDAEAPYIGCRHGPSVDFGGLGSGSTLSHSPGPSPMNSPLMGGRRSVSSAATSCGYFADGMGFPVGNRGKARRFPSTPISPQPHPENHPESRVMGPPQSAQGFPTRSRSTDLLLCWRPEEGATYRVSEPNPFHFPSPNAQRKARVTQDANHHLQQHLNARWPTAAPCRSPPPPPPPRDPQRKLAPPPQCYPKQIPMREVQTHQEPGGYVARRTFHAQTQPSPLQIPPQRQQPPESPYVNVIVHNGRPTMATGVPQGVQACLADSQPRSRRPLRVTPNSGGYYGARPTEVSYMSDSQVGSPGRRQVPHPIMMKHPPLEAHHAVPFLAESPPPRCIVNRVMMEPPLQATEGVVHPSRPLMRQQRLPVFNRSRSSSPAPAPTGNRPPVLHIRPLEGSGEFHPFAQRGHSSAPQTPIDGPINRPLSIVSEEKGDVSPRIPPVPPARSSSRRSSISSLEALEYVVWGADRPPRVVNKGPSGLEDALTELENIYKSLKFEDEGGGDTDSNAMGSSEMGVAYDDQDRPLTDDMAYRRLHSKEKTSPTSSRHGVGGVVAQAGSYLLVSPTLGPADPWTEPPPNSINPGEPDITLDDVVYRSVRQANAHIPQDPQPLFGIPLGPVTRAPESDYLHVKPPSPSPNSRSKKTPDVVKDDLAFRSLRKDRPAHAQPVRPIPLREVTSPPPRPSSSLTCISSPPPLPPPTLDFQAIRKKRAVRSLSANLLGILQTANASARSTSPPMSLKSALPPQSPPSPRREQREISFSTASPTHKPVFTTQSPSEPFQAPPPSAQSEDSEPCNDVLNAPQCPDATSSDTLAEVHTDEPKPKQLESKDIKKEEQPMSKPQTIKDSPGEVYEALGRVLSRVGKESVSGVKGIKPEGEPHDDLETLLVALAKEARATSENLGRELDQLRTTTIKMTEDIEKTRIKADKAFEEEFSKALKEINKDVPCQKPRPIDSVPGDDIQRTKEYLISRSSSPGRVGAIASLALRELEKPRALSSSSSPDSTKMDGMSVVVGKCTVGKDSSHPGSIVSFTSSVGPIKSEAKRPSGKIDSPALEQLSAASEEIPMKSTGESSVAKESANIRPCEISTSSAGVPIKSGRPSFEVVKELPEGRSETKNVAKVENKEESGKNHPDAKFLKDADQDVKEVARVEQVPSTLRIISETVDNVCIGTKTPQGRSIPSKGSKGEEAVTSESKSDQSKEQSPTMIETTPITGSMRLIVRREPERSITSSSSQNCVQQCSWVVRSEPDQDNKFQPILTLDSSGQKPSSVPSISNEQAKRNESKVRPVGDVAHAFSESEKIPVAKKEGQSQATPPSEVVEEIQREFDQLLCSIPAKKARKSDERECSTEFSSAVRPRLAESKSLEHPRRTGRDTSRVAHDNLRRTFPKNFGSSSAKSGGVFRKSNSADAGSVEEVSCAFEQEFEELWKATIEKDCEEMKRNTRIDETNATTVRGGGALESQLDQLRVKSEPFNKDEEDPSRMAPKHPSTQSPEDASKGAAGDRPDEKEAEGEVVCRRSALPPSGLVPGEEDARTASSAADSAACPLKPAVAALACLTPQAIRLAARKTTSDAAPNLAQSNPGTFFSSSAIAGLIPEPGDPLFTALAAFLALVSLIAALIVQP